ncbi:RagB/SusD family nutrient uptake outer membrane protein [Arundinibacter roseus]|uniref:RagB/SusD family nutrient uptake outer membrane protein n=1 Tax=Arundinibacter roseus TaxID=2070510 RepID=A0A4R4K035_9BACT|nr:RagB/SusD family nutrient uptake outer membrane protein [Arundinibacter roseus]TDB60433.1 RagB/SusD family nutrient uptake outer membrane protein [Arundinibacter roseus]
MKKALILTCFLSFALASCDTEDFLTITPETALSSATFFKTEADFQQAVNGAYVPLRAIHNGPSMLLSEQHSDNARYVRNILFGATENQGNLADFNVPTANGITTNSHVLNVYRQNYQIIARTNQILALIDGVDMPAASKNNLKGQALFLRALAYFDLVRYFNRGPLHLTPVAERSAAALPLATGEALYAQVIKDAQEALTLLPPKSVQEAGRATSGSAGALLANVYMIQKKWAEAEAVLRTIVTSNQYSLIPDYANVFSTTSGNKNNSESVFEVQYLEGAQGLNGTFLYGMLPSPMAPNELVTITGTSNPQPITGEGNNIPTPDIIAAYEPGDKRKDVSVGFITLSGALHENKTFPHIKKYAKPHSLHNNHGMNWPVYRYSEVLLFMAEALMEQNKLGEAIPFLNQVRNRAGLENTTASSQTELRAAIYQERRVELAFEAKRLHDLVRTGRLVEVITAYGNRVKADKAKYYYPKDGFVPGDAFTNLDLYYGLPAAEADLSPNF